MTIDATAKNSRHLIAPELAPVLDMLPAFELNDEVLRAIREMPFDALTEQAPPLTAEQQSVQREECFIPGPPGAPEVRVLVYTPAQSAGAPRPAYLHIHGGGYVLGNPEINDQPNRTLVAKLNCVVVSVDYRLAPETRFPGAVEDCYAALSWLVQQAEALNIDPGRIAIGGESAGGGHAAALGILVRNRGEIPLCLQLLDSPMLDDRTGSSADDHPYCGEFVWTAANNRFGWRALLGVEPGSAEVPAEAVPARVADLGRLPPTFLVIGALDLFLEESMEYARRLIRAGVPTELYVIPGAFHAFGAAGEQAPQVQTYQRLCHGALARAWGLAEG